MSGKLEAQPKSAVEGAGQTDEPKHAVERDGSPKHRKSKAWHISTKSKTTTTTSALTTSRIAGYGGDIFSMGSDPRSLKAGKVLTFNTANAHASASQSPQGSLGARTRGLGASATRSSDLDVNGRDANLLAASGNVLSCQHGGVGRRLVAIGLDLHAASDANDGFLARQIRNVDKGVVERSENVGDAKQRPNVAQPASPFRSLD
jgi:hypothetical protein